MPPEERIVCRFAAEPPQGPLPYGRWADRLQAEFLAACLRVDAEGADLGEAVALQVGRHALARLARVLGIDLLEPAPQRQRLLGVDGDVGRLALELRARLVDEDARVR